MDVRKQDEVYQRSTHFRADVLGYVRGELETRYTTQGRQYTQFRVAVGGYRSDVLSEVKATTWVKCVMWHTQVGDQVRSLVQRGALVNVFGYVKTRTYQGKAFDNLVVENVIVIKPPRSEVIGDGAKISNP